MGNGPYMFGVDTRDPGKKTRKIMAKIANKHGAKFVCADMPEGWRQWFQCENYGESYNKAIRDAVVEELEANGIEV